LRIIQTVEQLGNSLVVYGMYQAWGNFLQGMQDETPLAHKGVGDGELGRFQDVIVIEQDIKINGSGSPGDVLFLCKFPFYSLQERKQVKGGKGGLYFYYEVNEIVLIPVAPRLCVVERRLVNDSVVPRSTNVFNSSCAVNKGISLI